MLVDPDNRTPPDVADLDALVERAAVLDGRAAWAEPESPAARAVTIRRLLDVRRTVHLAGYAEVGADEQLIAFARLDADGAPALVTIVPRAVDRPTGLHVDLPPGTWRHVLLDDEPDARERLDVDAALSAFPAVVLVRDDDPTGRCRAHPGHGDWADPSRNPRRIPPRDESRPDDDTRSSRVGQPRTAPSRARRPLRRTPTGPLTD